jgi:hypothetical protein
MADFIFVDVSPRIVVVAFLLTFVFHFIHLVEWRKVEEG